MEGGSIRVVSPDEQGHRNAKAMLEGEVDMRGVTFRYIEREFWVGRGLGFGWGRGGKKGGLKRQSAVVNTDASKSCSSK